MSQTCRVVTDSKRELESPTAQRSESHGRDLPLSEDGVREKFEEGSSSPTGTSPGNRERNVFHPRDAPGEARKGTSLGYPSRSSPRGLNYKRVTKNVRKHREVPTLTQRVSPSLEDSSSTV